MAGEEAQVIGRMTDAELLAELDRPYPSAWMPAEGEVIIGDVLQVQESVPTKHGPVPVVTLLGPNAGRRSLWLVHEVLRNEFIRARVLIGEQVAIRYDGTKPRQDADDYEEYSFFVNRPLFSAPNPDWDAIALVHAPHLMKRTTVPRMPSTAPKPDEPPAQARDEGVCPGCGGQGQHTPDCPNAIPF